ncbi:MAG: pyrroline-5-carboxylate reductase [Treponema sp. CETP13]|nr:MAG: pyrroline-5-carboxylate reductase [Treponema sp. CETP13]
MNIQKKKVAFIGCGVMGGALVKAVAKVISPSNIFVCDHNIDKLDKLATEIGVIPVANYTELLSKNVDFLFLASKPQYICEILSDIYKTKTNKIPEVIISIAAGITLKQLHDTEKKYLSENNLQTNTSFVRLMPNTPAQIGEGMIALSINESDKTHQIVTDIKALLEKAGKTEQVSEKLMDAVTAISGSGPAYVYLFIEALADAAVAFGMSRKNAYTFAAQTVKGSAAMVIKTEKHPGLLKDAVCSPGGTTIAAVEALEDFGMRRAIQKGAQAAFEKSFKMSNNS